MSHLRRGGCLCIFPGAGVTVFDRDSGIQSDAPYLGFSHLLMSLVAELIHDAIHGLAPGAAAPAKAWSRA